MPLYIKLHPGSIIRLCMENKKMQVQKVTDLRKNKVCGFFTYTQSDYLIRVNLVYDVGIWYNRMSWNCAEIIAKYVVI